MVTNNIGKAIKKFTDSQFISGSDNKRIVFYNTMKEITSIIADALMMVIERIKRNLSVLNVVMSATLTITHQ